MSEAANTPRCAYTRLDNGIHEFIFYDTSKQAVDDFFRILEGVLTQTPHTETARYIVDITKGDKEVSLVVMVQRFRRLEAQIPHRARGRTVVLHKPGLILSFIDSFVRALAPSRDVTRFFPVAERDAAIEWLLAE
ncbi:MAG: hypothetical protein JNJ61_10230 [Anaerolineae bacterium]|nr:hypothetical protein [Anaerolineae bacterium]